MQNHLRFQHAAGLIPVFWFWFFCALAALSAAPAAHAQGADFKVGLDGSYSLSSAFTVLEDRGAALTLDEVLQPAQQALFRPVSQSGSATNFGLTASAFWLRIQLRTEADAPRRPGCWKWRTRRSTRSTCTPPPPAAASCTSVAATCCPLPSAPCRTATMCCR